MRRLPLALIPAVLSLLFVILFLGLLAEGTAAAQPVENAAVGLAAIDQPLVDQGKSHSAQAPVGVLPVEPELKRRPSFALLDDAARDESALASLEIQVNYAHDWVAGATDQPGATVWVTLTNYLGELKADDQTTADDSGNFFVGCGDWSGDCPDIMPGDRIEAAIDVNTFTEIYPIGSITAVPDEIENTVSGKLNADWFGGSLGVSCEVREESGPPAINTTAETGGGSFTCDFDDVMWDLQRGQTVAVRYTEPDGDSVVNIAPWPWMRVNYGHDWAGGNFAAGHTFSITVKDGSGGFKASALIDSILGGSGWGSESFQTDTEWTPAHPDIQPGDVVSFATDGYSNTIQVGTIGGSLDIAADEISGTINAPGPVTALDVECHPWGAWDSGNGDAPVESSTAASDGSTPYTCAWDPGSEWDIQPGQDIAVLYVESDGDMVINVYRQPAPYLRISKGAESQATAGGNYKFTVNYWNQGDLAENVVITDTMLGNLSYLADTSGLNHSGSGAGPIVWDVGEVGPGQNVQFDLFVSVGGAVFDAFTNTVEIATSTPYDQGEPWEKTARWEGVVQENDTHLNVGKWAWTGDPTPGHDFIFTLNLCNNGSTGSSKVTLDDVLQHPAMTLQNWWAREPGWSETYRDPGHLTLTHPSIPGGSCYEVYPRVHLDAGVTIGENLGNQATISAANDLETGDNEAGWGGNASYPHINLTVDKSWHWGQLTPGGELTYGINYYNNGNVPAGPILITDTFPTGTSFVSAWHNDLFGGYEFPPTILTPGYAVWELPDLENGAGGDIEVRLAVDPGSVPGTPLVNKAKIIRLPGEDTHDDNEDTWTEILNPPGPNLRVEKFFNWEGNDRLNYQIHFENIGDQPVSDFWVTDDYLNGQEWVEAEGWSLSFDWARFIEFMHEGSTLFWNFSELNPGDSGWLYFKTTVPEPGVPFRWYTNTAAISEPPGDVNPDDNWDDTLAFSGPEVRRVEFWLNASGASSMWGEAAPGLTVTVTTPFGDKLNAWADPGCGGCWSLDDVGPLNPGDVVVVEAGAGILPVVAMIPTIDVSVDTLANEVSGQILPWSDRPVEIHGEWPDGYRQVTSDGAGYFLASYPGIPTGGRGYIRFVDEIDMAEVIFHRPFQALDLVLDINYGHNWVEGFYEPGHTVWITVTQSDGHTVRGTAELWSGEVPWWNGGTGFSTNWQGWSGSQPDLQPGDWVYGQVDNGYSSAVQIGDIDFTVDYINDIVAGTLNAPFEGLLSLRCELWNKPGSPAIDDMVDPDGGEISCDFGGAGYDIQAGHSAAVMYWEPDGERIINVVDWPVIRGKIGPNSNGDREVWGHYAAPNGTVFVTVTTSFGDLVAGEITTADEWGNWNTNHLPEGTLALWNEVQVDFANGLTDTMTVYPLVGVADPDTDVVEVTAAGPPFFNVGLNYCNRDGWCDWFDMGQIGDSGVISANLMAERGFNVRLGDSFEAQLTVSNNHVVIYAWALPAAEVGVWKSAMDGHARPGGVFAYSINYANQGNGPAENTLIVDTLPPGASYAGDTSGFPVTIGPGNVITWELGAVDPSSSDQFVVTLDVSPDMPTGTAVIDQNCLSISTTSEGDWDPENNSSCAGPVDVWEDEVEIGVDKWASPEDPHPGQEFEYTVQWCNNRGAAAGPAVLTDTLPAGVHLLDYWLNDWFDPWTEVQATDELLVLQAAGLPGNRCDSLTMRLLLDPDVAIGTTLENLVEIAVAGDVYPDNNWYLHNWAQASPPRLDLSIRKSRMGGILVPGGEVRFNVGYSNNGNVETTVRITDTIPPGFSYLGAWWAWHTPWGDQLLPEPSINDNQLIWDLPAVPVNGNHGFDILLGIGQQVDPVLFENCMTIAGEGLDSYLDDNDSCAPFYIRPTGPNLWIEKSHYWQGDGQLRYEIYFGNFGDQAVSDVWITETLPAGTYWDEWWDGGHKQEGLEIIIDGNQLKWHFDVLEAGAWSWVLFNANLDDPGAPMRWYTNTALITLPPFDTDPDNNLSEDVAFSGGEVQWLDVAAYGNEIWGYAPRGPIIIRTPYEEDLLPWDGDFNWNLDYDLLPGDLVTITAGSGLAPLVVEIPDPFDVEASSINDHVWGQTDHLDGAWLEVELNGGPVIQVQTDNNGFFDVAFPDIPRYGDGEVRYHTVLDYSDITGSHVIQSQVTFHRRWRSPDLALDVNYGHNWVEGSYEPGHTVWITVTENDGHTVKGTAELQSGEVPWWGGNTGFSTNWHGWTSPQPDLAPGDWVFARADNGFTGEVHIFTIDGYVDVDGDFVTGIISATWLVGEVEMLDVQCQPWGSWDMGGEAPVKESAAPPDGSTPFFCQWNPLTEYDIDYFQDFGIWVPEPGGNNVINVIQGEAVDLVVGKSRTNPEYPTMPGGVVVYGLWYQNNGNIPAENVHIVDTLPAYTSYAGDTGDLPLAIGAGNIITWDVGIVNPGDYALFHLTLDVSPTVPLGEGVIEPNCMAISSSTTPQANPGDEEACSEAVNVQEGDIDVSVNKWAWPDDPTPGESFYYTIEWCNNQPLDAGPAVMTDTLPAKSTLIEWHETEWWHNYWVEQSFDGSELVLYAPGLPGGQCAQIELVMALDPGTEISTTLVNEVLLTVPGDVNPDNNTARVDTTHVGLPRIDLAIEKRFHAGQLFPGGSFSYLIDYRNNGNIGSAVTITETVPPDLTFDSAWWGGGQEGENRPLPDPLIMGDQLIWHLDPLPLGHNRWFHVEFTIDPDMKPDTEFGNCVTISGEDDDAWPDDNEACELVTVNPSGANLRVTKRHWWPNEEQISYEIRFLNTGTESFFEVLVTDTLPSGVTTANWPSIDFPNPVEVLDHTADGQWGFIISELRPGEIGHIFFDVNLDDPELIPAWYTNIVTITTPPGDVDLDDNFDVDLAAKMLDVFLRISPAGEQIPLNSTFTVDVVVDNVIDLYGLSMVINFDPAVLQVVDADPAKPGIQIEKGSCPSPDFPLANTANNSGGVINYDVISLDPTEPCNGSGLVAQITFQAIGIGTSPIHFSEWLLANPDGTIIEPITEDGQLTVPDLGLIKGTVELQGRSNHSGAAVCAWDSGGLEACATTSSSGAYNLWVSGGIYTVTVEMISYLDGEKGGIIVGTGGLVTLAKVKLLGGDVNDDCKINIQDLAFMGARYKFTSGNPGYDVRGDVNADGVINILDIVMAGGNYNKVCPVAWP